MSEIPFSAPGDTEAVSDRRETILMVEDNPDVRMMGSALLGDAGFEVHAAADAAEALDYVRAGLPFDLLFTDIVMPGDLDGVALAHEARRLRPGVPVLLTTGWADRALDHDEGRSGYELIGKPYRRTDLAEKIRLLLDRPTGIG